MGLLEPAQLLYYVGGAIALFGLLLMLVALLLSALGVKL